MASERVCSSVRQRFDNAHGRVRPDDVDVQLRQIVEQRVRRGNDDGVSRSASRFQCFEAGHAHPMFSCRRQCQSSIERRKDEVICVEFSCVKGVCATSLAAGGAIQHRSGADQLAMEGAEILQKHVFIDNAERIEGALAVGAAY